MPYSDLVTQAESGGNPDATNPGSSASGPAGFTNSTWLETVRKNRPDLAGQSDEQILALKTDPQLSGQMADAYGNANAAILQKNGLPVTDGTRYLAHFAGPGGAVKILQADPNAPVESILSPQAIAANPFLKGMTAQGLQAWAAKKMGVASPLQGQTNAPASPAGQPAAPPQGQQPIFAQQQAPQGQAPVAAPELPQIQAPQIQYAKPRPIDLAALRAAFPSPIFARG